MSGLHTPTQIGQEEQMLAEFVCIADMVKRAIKPLDSSKKFEKTRFEPTKIERENILDASKPFSYQTYMGGLINQIFSNRSCKRYEVSDQPFVTCFKLHDFIFQPNAYYLLYFNTFQWLEENEIHISKDRNNKIAEKLRATLMSEPYRNCFKTQKRNQETNQTSINKLVDHAFKTRHGIHAVAIELGYVNEFKDGDLINTVEWSELILHRNALIKKIKSLREVVGYAWKMDTGFSLNKHIHLVLLVDTAMCPQSTDFINEIECTWQSIVSNRKSICVGHPTILSMNGMPYYASKSFSTDVENMKTRIEKYLFWKDEIVSFQTTAKTKMFSRSGLTH